MKRRKFIKFSVAASTISSCGFAPLLMDFDALGTYADLSSVEAKFYKKHPDREIECLLCPRFCKLGDKERGYCGVRENNNGTYYTLVYGKACSLQVDPIEKKPLFHFFPGNMALSLATAGCNVNCKFCQNWEISQVRPEQIDHLDFPPDKVVQSAQKYNSPIIAYTYSEPVVFYEYMYDTSLSAHKKGLKNVVISGGHINPKPLQELIPVVDAIKIDLKAFTQDFYSKYVKGELQPVLEAIKIIAASNIWLEIVYLVIPTLNDSSEELNNMCHWIKNEIGPDVPLHFSRFHPHYLLKNLPPTPASTLEKAAEIARKTGINYVYIGNLPGHKAENSYCPKCKNIIIQRHGFTIQKLNLTQGRCAYCKNQIPGVWG